MASRTYDNAFQIKHPFAIVFRYVGTVWPLVLPYCIFNTFLLSALAILKQYTSISLSILPQGHALMSLLIAYLGVSKVNLAYERYMGAQSFAVHAFLILRELHQLSIMLTEKYDGKETVEWRDETKQRIIHLIHKTVATLRNERHAKALTRKNASSSTHSQMENANTSEIDDPMVLSHALRSHFYHGSKVIRRDGDNPSGLELLERLKLVDLLHEFIISYRNLLRIASSPFPFALTQMGRTFVFVFTLTIPFVVTGDRFGESFLNAVFFVILLTYGFLGLEFVSRMLSNPFGGEIDNDFDIVIMGNSAIVGIEDDSRLSSSGFCHFSTKDRNSQDKVAAHSRTLRKIVEVCQMPVECSVLNGNKDVFDDTAISNTPYLALSGDCINV